MTPLIILNVIAWGALLIYMIPGAWSAARGMAARRGDPMRLGVAIVALLMSSFFLRRLLAPGSDVAFNILSVLSIVTACYIAFLAHAYGRGPRL